MALALTPCGARERSAAVDVRMLSGSPQTALAYAASTEPGYVTIFAQPLVVSVGGASRVRYRCVTRHCRFALSTQPDEVKRIDLATYEVRVERGRASLRPTLGTDAPGTFAVDVRAVGDPAKGGSRVARFVLTAR